MSEFQTELESVIIPVVEEQQELQEKTERPSFINGSVRDLGKGQDFISFGKEEDFDWCVLLDGHGSNLFINIMRRQNWREIMTTENPCDTLLQIVSAEKYKYGFNSGSTLLMMRAYSDRLETVSIGDSQVVIYKNNIQVYKSEKHNGENANESQRFINSGRKVIFQKVKDPIAKVVSAKKMRPHQPYYIYFEDRTKIAPTQALGHNDITGYEPEVHTEYFGPEDEMRCLLFSDGLGDMLLFESEDEEEKINEARDILTSTAEELVLKSQSRWLQEWEWHWNSKNPESFSMTKFPPDMMDDISAIVWDNKKAV
jgi:serine/threonine protein phosphatase PrpC